MNFARICIVAVGLPLSTFAADTTQCIVFNRAPGQGMYQGQPESLGRKAFDEVLANCPNEPNKKGCSQVEERDLGLHP